jgi:Sulfotransferase family
MNKTQVLYIAGSGRCGSTLLGSALEQVDGFFSPGELMNLWDRGIIDQHPCGCGLPLERCALWSRVVEQMGSEDIYARARAMMKLQRTVARTRHLPLLMSKPGRRRLATDLAPYVARLEQLYTSIRNVTGARVVVDGSKDPAYASVLRMAPSLEVHVLHLVRDPRAVVYSWQRRKELFPTTAGAKTPKVYMERHGIVKSTVYWVGLNLGVEAIRRELPSDRYLCLTYEDFVREPVTQLRRILSFLDIDVGSFPFVQDRALILAPNHSVSGNPSRFSTGAVQLKQDNEWRRHMPSHHKRLVALLSWPLGIRYRYFRP